MTYLKFAYLAEFAVAFNLAFGEFKQERIAQELEERVKNLDNESDGPLAQISKLAAPSTIAEHQTDYVSTKPTWLSQSVQRFDAFRNYRKERTIEYKPFQHFFSRALLFATNPAYLKGKTWRDAFIWFAPLRVIVSLPKGLLASWTYSKTKNWNYPPCKSSLLVWPLIVGAGIFFLFDIDFVWALGAQFAGSQSFHFDIPPSSWVFGLVGFFCGVFSLRPLSFFAAKFIGRPPVPRARYYSMIMVVIVTLILIALTLCEIVEPHTNDVFFERLSYFLIGLLTYATALPLMLLAGHLILEQTVLSWTQWAEEAAKQSAADAVQELKKGTI